MSRSTTYRPIELTEEELAEIVARARGERLHRELLPALRAQFEGSARRLLRDGSIPTMDLSGLRHRAKVADTVEELRSLTVAVGRLQAEGSPPSISTVAHYKSAAANGEGPERAGLEFDVEQLALEVESISRVAEKLDLALPELESVRREVVAARELARSAQLTLVKTTVESLSAVVAGLDGRTNDALAMAECQSRTIVAVLTTLGSMGFAADVVSRGEATVIFGHAEDGRAAEIKVSGCDEDVEFASTFTDSGSAVERGHPDAGSVCDAAVLDQAEFHQGMQCAPGLRARKIRVSKRPTRGPLPPSNAGSTMDRPNHAPNQHRSIQ